MIYLASPYSHEEKVIRYFRYQQTCRYVVDRLKLGEIIYSPIVYCHHLAEIYGLPCEWSFWENLDTGFILKCKRVKVLKLDGWEDSLGIKNELIIAGDNNIPVTFVEI